MPKMNGKYDANSVRTIQAGGHEVSDEDDFFNNELGQWEQRGVPAELVHLARPMLVSGKGHLVKESHMILNRVANGLLTDDAANHVLYETLRKNQIPTPKVPRPSEDDILAAWDDMSGTGKRNDGNISFGHSEQTARQARQGINPKR